MIHRGQRAHRGEQRERRHAQAMGALNALGAEIWRGAGYTTPAPRLPRFPHSNYPATQYPNGLVVGGPQRPRGVPCR